MTLLAIRRRILYAPHQRRESPWIASAENVESRSIGKEPGEDSFITVFGAVLPGLRPKLAISGNFESDAARHEVLTRVRTAARSFRHFGLTRRVVKTVVSEDESPLLPVQSRHMFSNASIAGRQSYVAPSDVRAVQTKSAVFGSGARPIISGRAAGRLRTGTSSSVSSHRDSAATRTKLNIASFGSNPTDSRSRRDSSSTTSMESRRTTVLKTSWQCLGITTTTILAKPCDLTRLVSRLWRNTSEASGTSRQLANSPRWTKTTVTSQRVPLLAEWRQ